ncbi:DNA/RNA nuclease SfsA [Lactobacillus sp. LC28-10]|uniref:Sugar fermentation stimulation protein homolog n=1 Tax=Secundilactobacillus angelensis TaxID=2722706 RepID=A0ABX1KXV0_9LACO|nr:DNA/RNA nuclease SfsA [Secundilactobacillus angelensis]MCH5462844.1 DNA/RNA nuclease SfsA [Secundilactobacillus angelensis]NLR18778.1 DNA/RNA nuclease SfsA [Secundilactobacillus angelensis]
MQYEDVKLATFIDRPNRFIAHCKLADEIVTVHVKNTGRGKELLIPETQVALNYQPKKTRKTQYDLIAVKKQGQHWINIDSQLPNQLVKEAQLAGKLNLPDLPVLSHFKPETVYHDSRIDFWGQTNSGQDLWIEVKGVTLENHGVAAFPDAPTVRAVKHVHELTRAVQEGAIAYLLFVVQLDYAHLMTIYRQRAPKLTAAIEAAQQAGVHVVALDCNVAPDTVTLRRAVPFDLNAHFEEAD